MGASVVGSARWRRVDASVMQHRVRRRCRILARFTRLFGGYAFSRIDLRLLYASVFLSFLGTSVIFPLRLLYAQAHHATPAQLGLMAASFLIAPLLVQVPMGWLVDAWGRVPVLLFGLISHTLLSALYIVFNTPEQLIALRFFEGISVSAFRPSVAAYIADVTPEEHRSEAYGGFSVALNAGMLVGPLIGGLVGQYIGFGAAFAVNFAVEGLAVVLVWGRVHEPVQHQSQHDGAADVSLNSLATLPLIGAYGAFFGTQVAMGVLGSLWSIWLRDLGGSYTYIGATFTVFAIPQILFGASAGRAGDRFGRGPILLGAGLFAASIYASYGFVTNLTLVMALGIVEGLAIIFQQPVAQGLLADASPPQARGRVQGLAGAAGAIGGASAAFACLPLYHASRAVPFLLAGGVMAAGSLVAALGAYAQTRRQRPMEPSLIASAR
ncbi:MAG: MFS transporter [Chloroflexota bacterium]